jgi:hypothetical protein
MHVPMHSCTFSDLRLAVFAAGTGTAVKAVQTTLSDCEDGMVADGGAALALESSALTVTADSAVVARGASKASLHKCSVQNAPQSHVEDIHKDDCVAAVEARSSGTVDATALDVGAGAAGVAARGRGSTAAIHGCHFSDLSAFGVLARDGGSVTAGRAPEAAGTFAQTSGPAAAQDAEVDVPDLVASLAQRQHAQRHAALSAISHVARMRRCASCGAQPSNATLQA